MPYITQVEEEEATGQLKDIYEAVRDPFTGKVSNVRKVFSIRPEALRVFGELSRVVLYAKDGLTRQQREMIAVTVSAINRCRF